VSVESPDPFLGVTSGADAADAVYLEACRFLHREARLLDEERYADWLELFLPDARYWMPVPENRYRRDPAGPYQQGRLSHFDDTLETLRFRIRRLESGLAWPEDPPTRHVYAISNIEVAACEEADALLVRSVFTVYRNKLDRDQSTLMGRREDVLRRADGALRLHRRKIVLSQSLLLAKNLNVFF
jgi:ethylbenzene dioxygenase beta subunit